MTDAPTPLEERSRGLQRLRSWTVACVVAAAGLVGLLSILAANSFPGHGGGASAASPGSAPASADQAPVSQAPGDQGPQPAPIDQGSVQPQSPPGGFFGSRRGGRGSTVSGGS